MPGSLRTLNSIACKTSAVSAMRDAHLHCLRPAPAGRHDFSFLIGQWLVDNRRLAMPFGPSDEWQQFDTVHECKPLLDGLGHADEASSDAGPIALMLRFFDRERRDWTLRAVSADDGRMQPTLRGRFAGGRGVFVGEGIVAGRRVWAREIWHAEPDHPRCERAFSLDGGESWRTWWMLDLARVNWPD